MLLIMRLTSLDSDPVPEIFHHVLIATHPASTGLNPKSLLIFSLPFRAFDMTRFPLLKNINLPFIDPVSLQEPRRGSNGTHVGRY